MPRYKNNSSMMPKVISTARLHFHLSQRRLDAVMGALSEDQPGRPQAWDSFVPKAENPARALFLCTYKGLHGSIL